MSRWFSAFCPVFASLAACSGAPADADPSSTDDSPGTETSGPGATSATGGAGVGGAAQASAGSQMGGGVGGGAAGGANAEGGTTTRTDAASATEGGVQNQIATLPLTPTPGTPGIDYLSDLTEEPGATNGWGPFESDQRMDGGQRRLQAHRSLRRCEVHQGNRRARVLQG